MKNIQRLLLIGSMITVEMLCAQTTPAEPDSGHRHRGRGGPGHIPPVLRALDADRDGELSATEIAGSAAAIRTLDVDADGSVSLEELRPARPTGAPTPSADGVRRGPGGPGGTDGKGDRSRPIFPVMLALDANADGALAAMEIENAPASLKALDANADGKLTRDELRPLPPTD